MEAGGCCNRCGKDEWVKPLEACRGQMTWENPAILTMIRRDISGLVLKKVD